MSHDVLRALMYHRVIDPRDAVGSNPSVGSASPDAFAWQVRHLAKHYRVVSSEEVLDAIGRERPLPDNAVLITFDDAYRDFGEIAWPILRRAGLPATVFVPTAYPGNPDRVFWWERLAHAIAWTKRTAVPFMGGLLSLSTAEARAHSLRTLRTTLKRRPHAEAMRLVDELCAALGETAPPRNNVLSWDELRELGREGVTLAAHTRTHPALTQLPLEEARAEICGSRDDLARELGTTPRVFSYPFGEHNDAVVELVREAGFETAYTCLSGYSRIFSTDPLRLRRLNITRRTTPNLYRVRLLKYGCDLDRVRQIVREWRHGALHSQRSGFGSV